MIESIGMSQMRKFFVKNVKVFRLYFLVIKRHLMKAPLLKKNLTMELYE